MIAFVGALALTLVLAAPVAALQKIKVFEYPFDFEEPVSVAAGWDFECSGPQYYGGKGVEKFILWYPNNVTDFMPEPVWPWVQGKFSAKGTDFFSTASGRSGKVVSGNCRSLTHIYDHDQSLPENWKEKTTGNYWGLTLPGMGPVFKESGQSSYLVTVIDQTPGAEVFVYDMLREFRGKMVYDVEKLCGYFGYEPVFPG